MLYGRVVGEEGMTSGALAAVEEVLARAMGGRILGY